MPYMLHVTCSGYFSCMKVVAFWFPFHWNVFLVVQLSISHQCMMTSSNGNILRVTGHLCGEFTGPVNSPHKGQWRGALMFSLICAWINRWITNREAGDLRRNRAHYDINVMVLDYGLLPKSRQAIIRTNCGIGYWRTHTLSILMNWITN